jgi:hypothetical protein
VTVGAAVVGDKVAPVPVPQIWKPVLVTELSLVQVMVEPAATCTPPGPLVPLYCTPFTVSLSYPDSVVNAVTDSSTASFTVMVQAWLLP